jgi:hypothetical protein
LDAVVNCPVARRALQGFDVRYVEADTEFARYAVRSADEQAAQLRAYVEPDLLLLDDLFLARRTQSSSASMSGWVLERLMKNVAS